jgi:hypothetical protein
MSDLEPIVEIARAWPWPFPQRKAKMKRCFGTSALMVVLVGSTASAMLGADIRVGSFGAIPDDGINDTSAIQLAINAAGKAPGSVVQFDPGIYDIAAPAGTNRALLIFGASSITLNGSGALLLVHSATNGILIQDSNNTRLENIGIDWGELPFAECRVVSFESSAVIVQIVGGTFPSTAGTPVTSLFLYDEAKHRPAEGNNDWYAAGTLTALDGNTARLVGFQSNLKQLGVGRSLLIRYQNYGANAIVGVNDKDLAFTGVSIYSAPGMAVLLNGCEDVLFSNFQVTPRPEAPHWISTNADGIHAVLCRGTFSVSDSVFEALGDDAFNIGSLMMRSQATANANQVILSHGKAQGSGLSPPRVGDILKFSTLADPYNVIFSASVVSPPPTGLPIQVTATLDKDVPALLQSGAIVFNSSAHPTIQLSRISIKNNRARGFWLQGLSGDAGDCTVSGSSGPAVELRADVNKWWEGPAPSTVNFTNCRFEDCNYGPGKSGALINSYAEESTGAITAVRAIDTITFTNCDFISSGALMSFKSTRLVNITNCLYTSALPNPVSVDASTLLIESGNNAPGAGFRSRPFLARISIKVDAP